MSEERRLAVRTPPARRFSVSVPEWLWAEFKHESPSAVVQEALVALSAKREEAELEEEIRRASSFGPDWRPLIGG